MTTTTHTVTNNSGTAERMTVSHDRSNAVQYDFYIPEAIWNHESVQTFLTRLLSIEQGATIFNGITGVWQGDEEQTRIYRLILRSDRFQRNNVTSAFAGEVGRLMAELAVTPLAQQAFMYTETDIMMHLSTR
jgi:heme/copper-type cytochrome/quinol oxidase subunit 1